MRFFFYFIFFLVYQFTYSQSDFGTSWSCHYNANRNVFLSNNSKDIISSTVKLSIEGNCSGVLINRNTSDKDLGFYILTANHCLKDVDFSKTYDVIFNYQSPNSDNESTPKSNRAKNNITYQSSNLNDDGYQYLHRSKLRLVANYLWGDFALLEIVTPVPPHFNVTYAGWNPNMFPNLGLDFLATTIHHPSGDIKKKSGTSNVIFNVSPVASSCYTITTVIDVLFGWIWKRRFSTATVCSYVDVPWITVPFHTFGGIEGGSSGSSIFNIANQTFGMLSGNLGSFIFPNNCAPFVTTYGKFHANYSKTTVKNTLNPKKELSVDLFGMGSRKIDCYENLDLPGAAGVSGEYFPAKHYQSENKIILQAKNKITTNSPITVHPGADYEFRAGELVTLGPGFNALPGSNVTVSINPNTCMNLKNSSLSPLQELMYRSSEVNLPKSKPFDISKYDKEGVKYKENNQIIAKIFPNPNNGIFTMEISTVLPNERFNFELCDLQGKTVYTESTVINLKKQIKIDIQHLNSGVYLLKISNDHSVFTERIIKE